MTCENPINQHYSSHLAKKPAWLSGEGLSKVWEIAYSGLYHNEPLHTLDTACCLDLFDLLEGPYKFRNNSSNFCATRVRKGDISKLRRVADMYSLSRLPQATPGRGEIAKSCHFLRILLLSLVWATTTIDRICAES